MELEGAVVRFVVVVMMMTGVGVEKIELRERATRCTVISSHSSSPSPSYIGMIATCNRRGQRRWW